MITSIDLDYFGTNDSRGEEIVIEIPENEYFNLMNNKYHKVRLELGSMAYPYQKNGKYYLKIYGRIENQNEMPFCKS